METTISSRIGSSVSLRNILHTFIYLFYKIFIHSNMANMAHAAQRLVRVPVLYHEGQNFVPPPPSHYINYSRSSSPPRPQLQSLV